MRFVAVIGLLIASSTFSFGGVIDPSGTIDFDEFTSPPVTCCFGSGVVGPLVYPYVTIQDGNAGGYVMNGLGWGNRQTSGDNLFGTVGTQIQFLFTTDVRNLHFDVINGSVATRFKLELFDSQNESLFQSTLDATSFGTPGGVLNMGSSTEGVRYATVTNLDASVFAVDTITFGDTAQTPEPASFGLLGVALSAAAVARKQFLAPKA